MDEITSLYKASLRRAREQWLALVENLENGKSTPIETLKYLLSRLINVASNFDNAAKKLLNATNQIIGKLSIRSSVISFLKQHADESELFLYTLRAHSNRDIPGSTSFHMVSSDPL